MVGTVGGGSPHLIHNGYLSRAVGVGLPATVFWLFFFLRPMVLAFRPQRLDHPWRLKQVFLLVIVPILILNMVETTAGDCRYAVGLLATLSWGFAERQRLEYRDRAAPPGAGRRRPLRATIRDLHRPQPISGQKSGIAVGKESPASCAW